ncbi:MAG TPA: MBL fold metallo-hydrolase [Candidatus Eisenbacteria bacterium]|nr:MBL fold metallo-hydrolase [Candidatus Eisenbacteria bacterium]
MLKVGPFELHAIESGRFALDGGAMFGIVPRPLWERPCPPDAQGRIALALRLLLIRGKGRTWLVDTGIGDKFDEKSNSIYRIEGAMLPDDALRAAGFDPADVTDVILTHLHFDHAGGTTRADGSLVFPRARHYVQRVQWEWAQEPSLKDRGSYRAPDFSALRGQVAMLEGPGNLAPGIEVFPVDGHTPAMQLPRISGGGAAVLYCADLVPTAAHVRAPWIMAYDNEPMKTAAEKTALLGRAAAEGWVLFLEHDARFRAVRVRRGAKDFEMKEEVAF